MARAVRDRVATHRARLRAQGLRPIELWVPDVRSPAFKAEAFRQSTLVDQSGDAREALDLLESLRDEDAG